VSSVTTVRTIRFKRPAHKPWGPMKKGEPARKAVRIAKRIRRELKAEGLKYGFNPKAAKRAMQEMRSDGYTGRDLYDTILKELRQNRKPSWDR
jgi:hypothetical protein